MFAVSWTKPADLDRVSTCIQSCRCHFIIWQPKSWCTFCYLELLQWLTAH